MEENEVFQDKKKSFIMSPYKQKLRDAVIEAAREKVKVYQECIPDAGGEKRMFQASTNLVEAVQALNGYEEVGD